MLVNIKYFGDIKNINEEVKILFIDFDDTIAASIGSFKREEYIALASPDLHRSYDDLFEKNGVEEKQYEEYLSFVGYAIFDRTLLDFLKDLKIPWYILSAAPIDQKRQSFIKKLAESAGNNMYRGYIFCREVKTECIKKHLTKKNDKAGLIDNSLKYGLRYNPKSPEENIICYHHTLMRDYIDKNLVKEIKKLTDSLS